MHLTRHARIRSQQRGLSLDILDCVLAYGRVSKAPGGTSRVLLDRHAIALASDDYPQYRTRLEAKRGLYLILTQDGRVITAAHQQHRFHA